jgi:hypothetical protein
LEIVRSHPMVSAENATADIVAITAILRVFILFHLSSLHGSAYSS